LKQFRFWIVFGLMVFLGMMTLDFSTVKAATKTITSTIVVAAGETYDGQGVTIVASGMGDGSQAEDQKPIFKLMKGASLKNVTIAYPGCDGVHCYGDNTVTNVVWSDVGEDALTVKGEGYVTVSGGSAANAADKVFQINQPCTFTVENFKATTFGKVIRQNGGTNFTCNIYINNCTFDGNGGECVARTDSSSTQLYCYKMTATDVDTLWRFPSTSQIHTYTPNASTTTSTSTTATASTSSGVKRLQSYNYSNFYVRHVDFDALIDSNLDPLVDSQWQIVSGLANSSGDYISFQSVSCPGYYLRHRNFDFALEKNDGSALFKADATFKKVSGLADSSWSSFQSYNYPQYYMRHYCYRLLLETISSATDKQDATFKIVD
jgi:pectate lyase C